MPTFSSCSRRVPSIDHYTNGLTAMFSQRSGTQRSHRPRESASPRAPPTTPKTPPSPPRQRRPATSPGQRLFTVSTQARTRPATPGASPSRLIAHRRPVSARLALPLRHSGYFLEEDAVAQQQRPAVVARRVSKVDPPGLETPSTRVSFSEPQIQEMPANQIQTPTGDSMRRVKKSRRFSLPILLGTSRLDWAAP